MDKTDTQWRVAYIRRLGDKARGLGPRDNFKFFDDLGNLQASYCAFLEYKDYGDEFWTVVARIFVDTIYTDHLNGGRIEAVNYVLVDDDGEKLTTTGLKRGILSTYLETHHPTFKQFMSVIDAKKWM